MIQCGSLLLVPAYVDSISSKDIDSAESSLHLMRKEDPYLLEVWVQEDHLNGKGSHSRSKVGIIDLFPRRYIETSNIS